MYHEIRDTLHDSRFTRMRYNLRKITYEIISVLCKTNPILSAVGGLQMNVNPYNTTDYENKWQRRVRKNKPNQTQFPKRPKMNVNLYVIEDYENETTLRPKKTNPNKANFKRRTYLLTGQSGFINMVSDKIIDNFAEVTGAWWCPWSSKPVWG